MTATLPADSKAAVNVPMALRCIAHQESHQTKALPSFLIVNTPTAASGNIKVRNNQAKRPFMCPITARRKDMQKPQIPGVRAIEQAISNECVLWSCSYTA